MREITLIFPDQLFEQHPAVNKKYPVILAEEFLYFRVQPFHKQKLVLMRAAMKAFASFLIGEGVSVLYIESSLLLKRGALFDYLAAKGIKKVHLADFADEWLESDLKQAASKHDWEVVFYPSPGFLCTKEEINIFFQERRFSMAEFYAHQRKKLSILMQDGKPKGGKFSFDTENRKRVPKSLRIPNIYEPPRSAEVTEAINYVECHFPQAIGQVSRFLYPTNFEQAKSALENFILRRLCLFGDYEDAMCQQEPFLFHSVLSPAINLGLLTPRGVLDSVLSYNEKSAIPLNSLEGFIRQIIGWREYMRAAYLKLGRSLRISNRFRHDKPLPKGFWDGTTGILPVDHTIQKILEIGYCHHIERLMVLGNYLLLMETDPNLVYEWFMANFVDAYDWVMVPNVYAMSQYSGPPITTKPYISGSNYILKMSDFPKGKWTEIWDGLFWRFFEKHQDLFIRYPRMKMLANYLENNKERIKPKIEIANQWCTQA